ncbi:MAG: 2-oxo acid dehydrogenase subunit E2, partial [Anaerolineales bacterium]
VSGTVLKVMIAEGSTAPVNSILVWIGKPGEQVPEGSGGAAAPQTAANPSVEKAAPSALQPIPAAVKPQPVMQPIVSATPRQLSTPVSASSFASVSASAVSPLVARIAVENKVDLAAVRGTGAGGRITKEDVLAYIQSGGAKSTPVVAGQITPPKFDGQNLATFTSPVVKKLVQKHNLDVTRIQGSGQGGRVTKQDIETVLASGQVHVQLAPKAASRAKPLFPTAFVDAIPGQVMKLNPVRKAIAEHMVRSVHTSPHVTTIMEADLSSVTAHRAANKTAFSHQGVNLTFTAYLVAAIVAACQAYPIVNSSWSEEGVAVHGQINVGVATALEPDGLIVPVIKNAGALSLLEIARAINDLAGRARSKQLKNEEVKDGTITLTNHGTSGSLFATPIINQPQCAIISTGAIEKRVKVIDDAIAIRSMMYLGLTFDHRILDGAVADYFLGTVKATLESWE